MSAARVCRPLTPLGWALALGGLLLTGCSAVGPDYQRPSVATPAQWQTEPGWQSGQPRDTEAKGDWWTVYGDPQLNALMALALTQNNTLALAQSRLDQARAQTNAALGARLPRVGLQGATSRYQTSANRPLTSYTSTNSSVQQNHYNLALTVSYEVDLAGRVRRQLEGVRASEAQSQADFENTRLLLGAQLASSYLALRGLDAEIRDVLKPDRIITPDDVRGNAKTLREAVTTKGWPTLERARGKIYFVLDTPSDVSDLYRAGHPSLKGRPIFGWYDTDQPEASVEIVGDPRTDGAKIKAWVKQGFIVRTRSDADTKEARDNDHTRQQAAIDSGAQAVSTDYYPGAPTRAWNKGFTVTLPSGVMQRCNPVTQPAGCTLPK